MQNEIETSTKKDLEKFIENSSFKKIFYLLVVHLMLKVD